MICVVWRWAETGPGPSGEAVRPSWGALRQKVAKFGSSLAGRRGVVVRDRDLPVRSKPGEEGEQGVGRPVATRLHVEGPGAVERSFLDGQVSVEVNPGRGRYVLVPQP